MFISSFALVTSATCGEFYTHFTCSLSVGFTSQHRTLGFWRFYHLVLPHLGGLQGHYRRKEVVKIMGFPGGSDGKACHLGDPGPIPGSGRCPGEGNGKPFQYSCLENSMDGGAWWATVHGVTKSRKQLSDFTSSLHFTVVIMSYQGDRDLRGKFQ